MSRFASFREFYPFYLGEHRHPVSRRLHVVGTLVMLAIVAFAPGAFWQNDLSKLTPVPADALAQVIAERACRVAWAVSEVTKEAEDALVAEVSLRARGLLDAWVSPDGSLSDRDGQALLDAGWYQRAPVSGTHLGEALEVTLPQDCAVDAATVAALLAGVAYGPQPDTASEAWLAPDGRYRLGTLAGAWHKPQACYVGHSARAQARQRRLEEIGVALARRVEQGGSWQVRVSLVQVAHWLASLDTVDASKGAAELPEVTLLPLLTESVGPLGRLRHRHRLGPDASSAEGRGRGRPRHPDHRPGHAAGRVETVDRRQHGPRRVPDPGRRRRARPEIGQEPAALWRGRGQRNV